MGNFWKKFLEVEYFGKPDKERESFGKPCAWAWGCFGRRGELIWDGEYLGRRNEV